MIFVLVLLILSGLGLWKLLSKTGGTKSAKSQKWLLPISLCIFLLAACSPEAPPEEPEEPEPPTFAEIVAELSTDVEAEISHFERVKAIGISEDEQRDGYVIVNVDLYLAIWEDRNASYFADDLESVLPIIQNALAVYDVPLSRIEFLAMTRDDLIDPDGVIRWVSVNGEMGLYSDLSWERNTLLDNVLWNELPRRLIEHVENMEITLMTPGGYRTGIYTGDIFEGVPNGNGVFTSRNPEGIDWTYTGAFRDGFFHGDGVQEWDSGARREGTFLYGDLHGGSVYYDDGTLIYHVESGEWTRVG
ncbi:MAG: hypothetical protein FWE28_08690 [Oscillospiraceae bacterium]|nr:hypothetical protein [Oscillospiraceae bacterium]